MTYRHFRLLAAHLGVASAEVLRQLDFAASLLPRTRAIGVEVTSVAGSLTRVDAIAGLRGRQFEAESMRNWARALDRDRDDGDSNQRSRGAGFFDSSAVAQLAETVASELASRDGRYHNVWVEADGVKDTPFAPAIVCEHQNGQAVNGLELPFGACLEQISPATVARMKSVPFATRASMIGWMPGRAASPQGAGRLYWDQQTVAQLGDSESILWDAWAVPQPLQELATSARADGLDCAVAVNVTDARWACDGIEIAPRNRAEPNAWQPFDQWVTRCLPASLRWGVPLQSVFWSSDERALKEPLPDHIVGACAAASDDVVFVAKARPSHIKLSCRDGELRVKIYAGLEYAEVSSPG